MKSTNEKSTNEKSTHESKDLDINNYDLSDILNLFSMPKQFDEQDMKRAKQIVLKTHPDKSGLDSSYFLFYSKAYKVVYNIWEFQKKRDVDKGDTKNTDYKSIVQTEKEKKTILDNFLKTEVESQHFNKWFNDQFERTKIESEHDTKGYGDWLKSQEDDEEQQHGNEESIFSKGGIFDKKKAQSRALVVKKDITELYSPASASDLSGHIADFNSDVFSNLKFQDLYQAHTESVIPITDEDYDSIPKFANINDYMIHRSRQDIKPLSEQQAIQYLKNRDKEDDEKSMQRAFELARQSELVEQKSNDFWSNILYLKNK